LHIGYGFSIEDLGSTNGTRVRSLVGRNRTPDCDETAQIPERQRSRASMRVELGDLVLVGSVSLIVRPMTSGVNPIVREPVVPGASSGPLPVLCDPEMRRLKRMTERLAQSSITVLFQGETGVGKEIFAEMLHRLSPRCDRPLLRLNCGALPEALLESHLFGHERGAFTGAARHKPGLLEVASGGTVFLDEIGELPHSVQVKLLRVLEERQVLRIGGLAPRPIDVRFVTATNRDLEQEIRRGAFREDLYYRIGAVTLTIPPLRERASEVEPLARSLLTQLCREQGCAEPTLDVRALELMRGYAWPGNVRELKNVIARALVLCESGVIGVEHLPAAKMRQSAHPPLPSTLPAPEWPASVAQALALDLPPQPRVPAAISDPAGDLLGDLRRRLDEVERGRVVRALDQCAGNQTQAAKLLGISRRTLVTRVEEYRLPRPRKRMERSH
jgi:two-component system, NtrC family, response regulator AtoC